MIVKCIDRRMISDRDMMLATLHDMHCITLLHALLQMWYAITAPPCPQAAKVCPQRYCIPIRRSPLHCKRMPGAVVRMHKVGLAYLLPAQPFHC